MYSDRISRPSVTCLQHTAGSAVLSIGNDDGSKNAGTPALSGDVLNEINKQIILTAREGIIVYDRDLKYVLWNRVMEEMSGLGSHEVLGKHHSELFPFVKEQGLDRLIERALEGESVTSPDFVYYVPDTDKSGWASSTYGPLRDSNGEIVGVVAMVQDLTRLKLAEEALNQSEERYRSVVERATDVIYELSTDGVIISLNHAFETLTGWSRAAWMGRSFLGLLLPDDLPIAVESFRRVFRGEIPKNFELRFLSKSGEYSVGECTAAPRIRGGRVVAASGIVRDITARRRTEEALRQAESEYRRIFENALDGMFRRTPDGRFVLVNLALAAMLGYDSPEDLMESSGAIGFQCYANFERYAEYERLMNDHGMVERFENQMLRKDGRTVWISESSRAVRSSDGELLCYEGIIREIQRENAEEAARQPEEN